MDNSIYRAVLFAITAAAYTFLLVLLLVSKNSNRTRTTLVTACVGTVGWALAIATGFGSELGLAGAIPELASTGMWCVFALHIIRRQVSEKIRLTSSLIVCGSVICVLILSFAVLLDSQFSYAEARFSVTGELESRLGLSIFGVLLTENIYRNTARESRWHVNLLCIALGVIFAYGVAVYADALLFRRVSPQLWDGRAIAFVIATPLLAVSAARNTDWAIDIHVSRNAVFRTATLIGSGIFLLALAVTGEVLRRFGPSWGDLAEVALVLVGIAGLAIILTSGSARSRLRRFVSENFYTFRYDYRQEWIKSIEILSADPTHTVVQTRVIRAVAEIADSPAGILWVRDLDASTFQWAGSWNRPAIQAIEPADGAFIGRFQGGKWVIELSTLDARPHWLSDLPDAWLAVPLAQRDELIGFVILVNPRAATNLDRETFDLLRIVGRQAATHVAEQRYAQALADAQELREYGKRFAFVAHDLKNLASQMRMIVQNARLHGDNPEFHKDVIATVGSALRRMDELLERLRPGGAHREDGHILPLQIINEELAAIRQWRGLDIQVRHDGYSAAVAMDPAAFRSVVAHLCENAIEASGGRVELRIRHGALRVEIDVTDEGAGMTAEFIRDKLFQPFGSTKSAGFGIGAYQARELVRAAGGDLLVLSRPGRGTTVRILLPCVTARVKNAALASAVEVNG